MSQESDDHPLDLSMTARKPELLIDLPDVPTLAILSLLPLRQLIVNLPLVHPRLAPIRESILKATQRLVLHIGDQMWMIKALQIRFSLRLPFAGHLVDSSGALLYPDTDIYTFHLATLNSQTVKKLTSLMPGIVHLKVVISQAHISVLLKLTDLLDHWAPTLQTLNLILRDLEDSWSIGKRVTKFTVFSNLRHLIQGISSKLGALQTLTLDIGGVWLYPDLDEFLRGDRTGGPLSLSILGQLREFYLDLDKCPRAPSFLLEQLEAYATEKLTSIGLGGDFDWNQLAKSQFAARFTIVPLNINDYNPTSNRTFLRSFSNLKVYAFNLQKLDALELVDHLRALSTLSKLQCLKVHHFAPVLHPLSVPSTDLPSLSSVTVLDISIFWGVNHNHHHLQSPNWWTLFPSVQILKVTHFGHSCTICYPGDVWIARLRIPDFASMTPCLKQLFAPLRVIPSLRKIFYQRHSRSDNIAEFTAQGEFVCKHAHIGYMFA